MSAFATFLPSEGEESDGTEEGRGRNEAEQNNEEPSDEEMADEEEAPAHTALAPTIEVGSLEWMDTTYGWIQPMLIVSVTVFILRCTVQFVLTCCMQYGPLYGCSYLLA